MSTHRATLLLVVACALFACSDEEAPDATMQPPQEQVAAVLRGEVGAVRTQGGDGQEIVASYAPVPGTPWGLVVEEDWAALISSGHRYRPFLIVLLVLGFYLN